MYKTALKHVNFSTDVFFVCLNHAMSTDGEEIVGLLVGDVDEERVAHVSAVVILRRSDKRKDRVEISPEQLSSASTEAERLSCMLKRQIRIIGWYHSHPKLTVWPSPIDVNTQDSYQLMDEGFIGVIFSVFNEDPNKKGGRIQMTCFQSQTVIDDCNIETLRKKRLDIPVHLVPASTISSVCMNAIIQLPKFLCQEEMLAYQMNNQERLDYLTRIYNSSIFVKSMGQIAEVICGPMLKMLEERIINNEIRRKKLQERKKELVAKIQKIRQENEIKELAKADSPMQVTQVDESPENITLCQPNSDVIMEDKSPQKNITSNTFEQCSTVHESVMQDSNLNSLILDQSKSLSKTINPSNTNNAPLVPGNDPQQMVCETSDKADGTNSKTQLSTVKKDESSTAI